MRRVRGVVHGPAAGLSASKKDQRMAREATFDRAATLRPSFMLLFTRVRGRGCMKSGQTRARRLTMRRIMAAYTNASPLAHNLS